LDGVTRLADELKKAVDRGARVVFYSNRKHTKKDVAEELAKLKIEHIIVDDKSFYLHTKLFFVEAGDGYSACIGSANITKGGLTSNEELSVVVRGTKGDLQHSQITKYLAQLDLRCRANRTTRTAESGGKSRIKTPARKQRTA
jgi:HKD family nuclease